jgi:uncharacterized protein YbgA (DUF1722 family)/uncharacterized protein YbbK (DUF523 family)
VRDLGCTDKVPDRPDQRDAVTSRATDGSLGSKEAEATTVRRPPWLSDRPVTLGISSCLLGQEVRFDGGHKRNDFLTTTLGTFVRWVPVCPEVEVGLPTPRDSLRLERSEEQIRMVAPKSGADITADMVTFSRARVAALEKVDLCGYVFKKGSPSCGLFRVRVYDGSGMPQPIGRGLFAQAVTARWPSLPVEEEGRLSDPVLRESFVERVFAFRRLKDLFASPWEPKDLVAFHTAHKLQLLAHSPQLYREMGRFVADAGTSAPEQLETAYTSAFMRALEAKASRAKHTNVLEHALGHFKKVLSPEARSLLAEAIGDYRAGLVPLVVPVTLLGHYVQLHEVAYLAGQTYLEPHPKELLLRNHV